MLLCCNISRELLSIEGTLSCRIMDAIAWAQSFIARYRRDEPLESLKAAFEAALQTMGFRYFACVSHTDLTAPGTVLIHNYPERWVRIYLESQLQAIDPVLHRASRSALPFFWNDEDMTCRLGPRQREVITEAQSFGVENGYTIPIHGPPSLGIPSGSCSVVPDARTIDSASYLAVALMAPYLYHAASRSTTDPARARAVLSRRERQCLALVAQGKDDWAIGRLLHISEHTAHAYIESAKRRLGVATRAQAVAEALASGQLSPAEWRNFRVTIHGHGTVSRSHQPT